MKDLGNIWKLRLSGAGVVEVQEEKREVRRLCREMVSTCWAPALCWENGVELTLLSRIVETDT